MVESAEDRTDSDGAVMTLRPWSRRLKAGMRLGAPLGTIVYGLALIVAAPLAWQAGNERLPCS